MKLVRGFGGLGLGWITCFAWKLRDGAFKGSCDSNGR